MVFRNLKGKDKTKKILILILILASFLRLWKLSETPSSLFGDELDVGYQAYSILKTGRDYSGNFMPLHFESLAEWRTPLYLYSAVPTVALFGISALGVRLPAAIFGILGVFALYLLVKKITKDEKLSLVAALVLSLSPWHIQYSRAAFEVTQLVLLLILGLYLFFIALKNGRWLWVSTLCLVLTPWVYSTAKLFTPLLLIFLFVVWKKQIFEISKKHLTWAILALLLVGGPIAGSTLFGGGVQRFSYISVFSDPTTIPEVGEGRLRDARVRGELGEGLQPTLPDRVVHNKFTLWGEKIVTNYFKPFSTDFLFTRGDPNLRHSVNKFGQFYKVEIIGLLLGLILFSVKFKDKRVKLLILFWILVGVIPSSITRNGGDHATRLILILPPLAFLIAYGLKEGVRLFKPGARSFVILGYAALFLLSFASYQHNYWSHYPWDSERWWHSGFEESIKTIKEIDNDYERVIISMANEPAFIFFAGWYHYPPARWQKEFPIDNKVFLEGFGEVSFIDKFYFAAPSEGIYNLNKYLTEKDLYLAVAKEVGANLIMEPGRVPEGLKLLKAIPYPSGEPAFYLFSGK